LSDVVKYKDMILLEHLVQTEVSTP